jgi:hypothetical protein
MAVPDVVVPDLIRPISSTAFICCHSRYCAVTWPLPEFTQEFAKVMAIHGPGDMTAARSRCPALTVLNPAS